MRITAILILAACLALLGASPASGQEVAPPFNESYTLHDLGQPPEVPPSLGGLTLKAGTTDRLLIGGAANTENGALYEIGLVRDAEGHITGFSGEATLYAEAAYNDGGVVYGPDGVLFLARWPVNQLGQMKPGGVTTDKIVDMSSFEVAPSLAALQFVPPGQPGERSLKLSSWEGGEWYDAHVAPDGEGTFDVTRVTAVPESRLPGGPEGFVFVAAGSPQFDGPSLLVSEYSAGNVAAYDVNANGDPIVSTRRDFIIGLEGAEGAFIDPVTGDFLFSTFGGGDRVIVVRGFAKPVSLAVRTNVINDHGGGLAAENFTVHVKESETDVFGSPQPGSESGALYAVETGKTYTVSVDPVEHYETSFGGDCNADGTVAVPERVQPVCTITANDEEPTARLKVINRMENDEGGGWFAEDFTVHVTSGGAEVSGSPQPGSEAGTDYALFAGTYTVSEDAARGYVAAIGGDCDAKGTVTLVDDRTKTCTIINRDVPVGEGLVVESYGPSRTDSEWGLAESFLTDTRGYLEDPANFGPNGTVARSLQVAPGIRAANARTLAGVDTFFTGWVETASYTNDELAALRDFVRGGGTLIATTDDTSHTMVDEFGLTQRNGEGDGEDSPTPNTITDRGHPIASGPFGPVTAFNQYFGAGHYPTLGDDAHEVGRNDAGSTLAVIEHGKLAPGSGAAIFVADVDVFTDHGGAAVNETLIKNLFAFATAEAPTLRVITTVMNDDGGTASPGHFSIRVRRNGTDVPGSPAPGLGGPEGRRYALEAGSYALSAEGVGGYTVSFSESCGEGSIGLALDEDATCTITLDDTAPTLRVVTHVVNDHGGSAAPSNFMVHVQKDGSDVAGSPQPGSASGTTYRLAAGVHVVSSDAVAGYATAISGDCAGDGSITLSVGQNRSCTITADDAAPPPVTNESQELPPPEAGKSVNAEPKSGTVKVKLKGTKKFVELQEGQQVPVGSVIDTTKGRVTLVAASDKSGGTATADFYAGIFEVGQTKGAKPTTTLELVEKLSCGKTGKASAAAKRKKKRRLWGDGSGKFRTDGDYSSATVRGTKWLVEDQCKSTLTKVTRGKVAVRDFVKRKTVIVRAGKQYVARPRR